MKLFHLIFIVLGIIVAIAAACWGQTADEPWSVSEQDQTREAVMSMRMDRIVGGATFPRMGLEPLQVLLDNPEIDVIDLHGATVDVQNVIISVQHSGKRITNGTLRLLPNAQIGNIKFIQGRTFNGDIYPAGMINFSFGPHLYIEGGFADHFELQEQAEAVADAQGWGANAITTITNPAGLVSFESVAFSNLGNSAIAGSFHQLTVRDTSFKNVAKHCMGVRSLQTGSTFVCDQVMSLRCGNAIDLHGDAVRYSAPDVARIRDLVVLNPTGRSKCSGQNWDIAEMLNCRFEQTESPCMNLWPAFDFARCPRRANVNWFMSIGFPTMGIGTLADTASGDLRFNHVYVRGSLSGMKIQQSAISVSNSEFSGVHHRYRSGSPQAQSSNVDTDVGTNLEWASVYDSIEQLYDEKNAQWGTAYKPTYWLPNSVRQLMIQTDSN